MTQKRSLKKVFGFVPAFTMLAVFFIFTLVVPNITLAIGPNFDYYTKVKFEYQYSDYLDYGWPSQIYFDYALRYAFQQPNPLLASFPEHRGLTRITQAFGPKLETDLMYHYSFLGETYWVDDYGTTYKWEKREDLYNGGFKYKVSDSFSLTGTGQYSISTGNQLSDSTAVTADLTGWMIDVGCDYDFAGFFKVVPSISLFFNEIDGTETNAQSYNLKIRQSLGNTTAAQLKYSYFNSDAVGAQEGLKYHTVTLWLSQWLETQTAVHLLYRYHADNLDAESGGPGLEISQYVDWATTLTVSYRNYIMTNDDPESNFSKTLSGDKFASDAYSLILSRTFWAETVLTMKYRFYTTNQDVRMNTYLLSIEHVF